MRTGVLRRTEQGKAHTLSPCLVPETGSPKRRRRSRTGKRNDETKSPRRLKENPGGGGFLLYSCGVGNIWRQRLPQSMEKPLLTLIFSVTARVPVLAEWEGFEPSSRVSGYTISNRARYDHFDTTPDIYVDSENYYNRFPGIVKA